jgi:hypothetical protein
MPPGPAPADGLAQLSVWRQTLAPGRGDAAAPHDCDEVVLCLSGRGEVHSGARCSASAPTAPSCCRATATIRSSTSAAADGDRRRVRRDAGADAPADGSALELPWRS